MNKILSDVTCIMSVYINDRTEWVRDAIVSIMSGTVMPGMFIIYCDGKIEKKLMSLLINFQETHSDVFCVYASDINRGRAYSRQFMFERASTKYVMLMDADDVCMSNRLEIQYQFAVSNPDVDAFGGHIVEFFEGQSERLRRVPLLRSKINEMIKYAQPLNHVTMFCKRDSVIDVGGYLDAGNCEDYYLIARMIVNGLFLVNVDQVLVRVRVDEKFIYRRRGFQIGLDEVRVIRYMYDSRYLNLSEFCLYGMYRFIIRTLPSIVIKLLYSLNRTPTRHSHTNLE